VSQSLLKRLLLCIAINLLASAYAAENKVIHREDQLKTVYLLHFAELTEWPESTPITICLYGHSPLRTYLPILKGLKVHGQAVNVASGNPPPIRHCQILFVSDPNSLNQALLTTAKSQHILLVSDTDNFAHNGGMIQFALRDNKLKLVVNMTSVKEAGLKLSSKLLRMAEILE